jgi:hypothetical protein
MPMVWFRESRRRFWGSDSHRSIGPLEPVKPLVPARSSSSSHRRQR